MKLFEITEKEKKLLPFFLLIISVESIFSYLFIDTTYGYFHLAFYSTLLVYSVVRLYLTYQFDGVDFKKLMKLFEYILIFLFVLKILWSVFYA